MSRISNYISQNNLLPETLAYRARVIADGGIVYDINYVDAIYKLCKAQGCYANGLVGLSSIGGIKVTNNRVIKRYNLFGTNDEIQGTAIQATQYYYNKERLVSSDGTNFSKIVNITLPAFTDIFITGMYNSGSTFSSFMLSQTGTGSDGFYFQGSYNRAFTVQRTSTNYLQGVANWLPNMSPSVIRLIYNASTKMYYVNKVAQNVSTIGGTTVTNSNVTADLYYSHLSATYGMGLNKDIFIFSSLTSGQSTSFDDFLNLKSLLPARNVNILFEGDSQFVNANSPCTTNSQFELNSLLAAQNKYEYSNNEALNGLHSDVMLTNFTAHINKYYNSAIAKNICIILMGVNDMPTQTVAFTQGNINSAVAIAVAKGFTTYVCTQRYTSVSTLSKYDDLNASIRSNAVANSYTVIDIAADSRWNYDLCWLDRTWYISDNLHPTDASHSAWAQIIYNAIIGSL